MPAPTSIPLNEHTRWILGQPCFAIADIARLLRDSGNVVDYKAEDEQATALHFLLNIYLEHGEAWRVKAGEQIAAMIEKVRGNKEIT